MKFKIYIVIFFIALTSLTCKKTALKDEHSGLVGSWTWVNGWSDGANSSFRLDLKEKGKYKLFNGSEKIDYGRLVAKNNRLRFESDKPFRKGYFSSPSGDGRHKIIYNKNDTLFIGSDEWTDFPTSTYVKKK